MRQVEQRTGFGDIVTLGWRTKRKGKARLLQHGIRWHVLAVRHTIQCMPGLVGPWLNIQSCETGDVRWIHLTHDIDFKILDQEETEQSDHDIANPPCME